MLSTTRDSNGHGQKTYLSKGSHCSLHTAEQNNKNFHARVKVKVLALSDSLITCKNTLY